MSSSRYCNIHIRYCSDSARHVRSLPGLTECYFANVQYGGEPDTYVDLRPWMDQTPITLPQRSSLQLTMNLFQKLGLRYILLATHGQLQGLLTKKDAAFAMNMDGNGVLREGAQVRGLLAQDHVEDDAESAISSDPLTGL